MDLIGLQSEKISTDISIFHIMVEVVTAENLSLQNSSFTCINLLQKTIE